MTTLQKLQLPKELVGNYTVTAGKKVSIAPQDFHSTVGMYAQKGASRLEDLSDGKKKSFGPDPATVNLIFFSCLKITQSNDPGREKQWLAGAGAGEYSGDASGEAARIMINNQHQATVNYNELPTDSSSTSFVGKPNTGFLINLNDTTIFSDANLRYVTINAEKLLQQKVTIVLFDRVGKLLTAINTQLFPNNGTSVTLDRNRFEGEIYLGTFVKPVSNLEHFHSLATFYKEPGLADPNQLSFKSPHFKNGYLDQNRRSTYFRLNYRPENDPSKLDGWDKDATFNRAEPLWSAGKDYCSYNTFTDSESYINYDAGWGYCRVVGLEGDEAKKNATFKEMPGLSKKKVPGRNYSDAVSIKSCNPLHKNQYWYIDVWNGGVVCLKGPADIKPGFVFEVGDPEKDSKVDMEEV